MYIVYSLLLACVALLSMPWWAFQMLRLGKYRAGFGERLGRVPGRLKSIGPQGPIWIHAVSVGEVLAVSQLVAELNKQYPDRAVFVSTTTATGQQLARQRFGQDHVFYMPLDFGFALRPYLKKLRPDLLILAETEFWPNLIHLSRRQGAATAIVNARISDGSFPRYRRFRGFFSRVLSEVDLFLAQTGADAQRLAEIGAPQDRVHISGNLKFDIRLSSASTLMGPLRQAIGQDSPVIVCGSTTEGEEELVLAAFQKVLDQFPKAVMIVAPRHPERFEKVAGMIESAGLKSIRRSAWQESTPVSGCVFLLDSVGELAALYALADLAFVGGSLAPAGGHNILEPAQYGVAVLTGPHTFNFREITRIFIEGGGLSVVTGESMAEEFLDLLRDGPRREQLGNRAKELFRRNTGATRKTLEALAPLLEGRGSQ
ncbi:MAG TPA: 3-deoxy-D-manno-octulosonic acid transferase [Candidatus Limnocylindrales bacterium]|nr:3-deoxy-D-manno-octulosonic acid transferase [Candidatus Limnocylindrales bacterium]